MINGIVFYPYVGHKGMMMTFSVGRPSLSVDILTCTITLQSHDMVPIISPVTTPATMAIDVASREAIADMLWGEL